MKKTVSFTALLLVLFAACKEKSRKEMLTREWRAAKLENADMEKLLQEQATFIDTFGTHTDDAANIERYGSKNIDSMRPILRKELEDYKAMQQNAVKNTWFRFREDGVALLNFSGQKDSANWMLTENDNVLVLDEAKLKGSGHEMRMNILTLTKDTLKLRFMEDSMQSTVTFMPTEK